MASVKGRAIQVSRAGGPFELVERTWPDPAPGEVRIRVEACGVCHSDLFVKEGLFPGIAYPRIPGHEIAGVIDATGPGVHNWKAGQRVGVGWLGAYCGYCAACRRGFFNQCHHQQITGITRDGGYADYVLAAASGLALIPDTLDAASAGPLLCAGVTTFNSLRNSGVRPGDTVAVLGIGGLGHLGVQFAARSGFRTVAIARGADKEPLALQLGAHLYIDSQKKNAAEELAKLGGANVILSTVTDAGTISAAANGLAVDGRLIVLGVSHEPIKIETTALVSTRSSVEGWASGSSIDSEDTMNFSALHGIKPMTEVFPLERAAEAYDRMMSGKARFRVVIATT